MWIELPIQLYKSDTTYLMNWDASWIINSKLVCAFLYFHGFCHFWISVFYMFRSFRYCASWHRSLNLRFKESSISETPRWYTRSLALRNPCEKCRERQASRLPWTSTRRIDAQRYRNRVLHDFDYRSWFLFSKRQTAQLAPTGANSRILSAEQWLRLYFDR